MKRRSITTPLNLVCIVLLIILSACGGTSETPAGQPTAIVTQPTSTQALRGEGDVTPDVTPIQADNTPVEGTPVQADNTPVENTPIVKGETGDMVADLGFRPEVNGFKFENYGGTPPRTNLTAADLRRLFGDQVCANLEGENCTLTPPAQEWMDNTNNSMNGGHCEGMAALSLIFYNQKADPAQFGAAKVNDLNIDDNEKLQREIAFYFSTQATDPTASNEIKGKTPTEILDILTPALKGGATAAETYTMGIYKPGFQGGHAITPYAVQDKGNGLFSVLVYDNNFPNTTRNVDIDRNTNKWSYSASTNPNEPESLYEGDAETKTLTITRTPPRLEKQVCPFCAQPESYAPGAKLLAQAAQYNQVWLEGEANLLITDQDGKHTGYMDGKFVNEIPGVDFQPIRSGDLWKDSPEPVYILPSGIAFTITVDGSQLKEASVSSVAMIGPGYDLAVDEINLDPGQKDTITFSPDGNSISYKTDSTESPSIILGLEASGADYGFLVKGMEVESGGAVTINLDTDKGRLGLDTTGNKEASIYGMVVSRIDDKGEQLFGHNDIQLEPSDVAYLEYGQWKGDGGEMALAIDTGGDGTIDDTVMLTDTP
ncbi:MAG TPA: hypothetical protein VJ183_08470 [Chloroflexia bacterium]|nr:hypothetical protein [Chloroflexia bacterium]